MLTSITKSNRISLLNLTRRLQTLHFSSSPLSSRRQPDLPPKPSVNESEFTEAFVKGTGPGGQKINKTSSAVQLRHLPTGIVVKSQATRSREQNRKIARRVLAERIDELENGPLARTNLKEAIMRKKKASAVKKSKRKYRMLEEQKMAEEAEETTTKATEDAK